MFSFILILIKKLKQLKPKCKRRSGLFGSSLFDDDDDDDDEDDEDSDEEEDDEAESGDSDFYAEGEEALMYECLHFNNNIIIHAFKMIDIQVRYSLLRPS